MKGRCDCAFDKLAVKATFTIGDAGNHAFNELADENLAHANALRSFDQRKRHSTTGGTYI
jgi:hypothetical protein